MNSPANLTATEPAASTPRSAPCTPPPRSKFGLILIIVSLLVVIGLLAGLLPRWRQRAALQSQTAELATPVVTVGFPKPGEAGPGVALPAEVKPFVEAPIYARANGYVKRWLVDIGARVEAGQLLAEIDTPELNQELAQARAELKQAEAALELARTTAARWKELLKTSSVSQQETAEKEADLALKQSSVDAANANVRRLEELQSFEEVTAPFAGTITDRRTDIGQLISTANPHPLFLLADVGKLRVYARVPQSIARAVQAGQTADVTIPEIPNRVFQAKVVRTSGAMSADSRTLLTELELDNSKGEILSGSYAQVRFQAANPDAALTLPSSSLLFRAEGPQVGVVLPDGRVELRNIKIGRDFGKTMEVLSGVTATDRVIFNPSDSLVSGMAVRVAEREK